MSGRRPHERPCEKCGDVHQAKTKQGAPRCQKHSKRTGKQCGANSLKGKDRCYTHVGKAKGALLLEDVLGGLLRVGYLAVKDDAELTRMDEQNRIWRGREREIIGRIMAGEGESAAGWRAVRNAVILIKIARTKGAAGAPEVGAGLDDLDAITLQGAAREANFGDLEQSTRMIGKCSELGIRRLRAEHQMLSMDKVLELAALLSRIALKRIETAEGRAAFLEDLKLLEAGEEVEVETVDIVMGDGPEVSA